MENLLLNYGLSFTMAKLLPYVITLFTGLFLAGLILKSSFIVKKAVRYLIAFLVLIAPFGIYFAVNPIYQGDFNKNGTKLSIRNSKTSSIADGLLVLAIPGCPYCLESVESLKLLKKRNPNLKIQFAVTGSNDAAYLKEYQNEVKDCFEVINYKNATTLVQETGGEFPTFIMIKNGKALYAWNNNQFGVAAKDKLENW